jgi:DNA sulfur modification protein DndB
MGSTRYFQAVMTAIEVASCIGAAMDFEEFDEFMEGERMQRPLGEARVEREIVPYLCRSGDRFFGSLIVLAYQTHVFEFRPWSEAGWIPDNGDPGSLLRRTGVLTIEGGKLFALDGQHRLHALRTVTSGKDTTPNLALPIDGPFRDSVPNDELSVIFLEYESREKSRRIFNKVNRYAKPTSNSQNILTSEDDGYAIVTRCLLGIDDPKELGGTVSPPLRKEDMYGGHIVDLESTTLRPSSSKLTTLAVINESVKRICAATEKEDMDERKRITRPANDILAAAYDECAKWWELMLARVGGLSSAVTYPDSIHGSRHMGHPASMVLRPKGLEVLISGLCEAYRKSGLTVSTLVKRLAQIDTCLAHDPWVGVLCGTNGKMKTSNADLAARLVKWQLIGSSVGVVERRNLEEAYAEARTQSGLALAELPGPVNQRS